MKLYLHALAMCQSMFCAIPCPWNIWDEKARGKMLLFLPLIGLELGILWGALGWLCRYLKCPEWITALALCVFPFAATGYMHLDGYMDVTDAVKSWRSPERRREILKDSHVGSFAVIGVVVVLLAQFVFFAAAPTTADLRALVLVPAVSRCGSALAIATLPPMETSQYAGERQKRIAVVLPSLIAAGLLAAGFLVCGRYGLVPMGCVVGYALALRRSYRSLGGMNGDVAGYALTWGELCAVAVYALI